jgi:hypothetical protein
MHAHGHTCVQGMADAIVGNWPEDVQENNRALYFQLKNHAAELLGVPVYTADFIVWFWAGKEPGHGE